MKIKSTFNNAFSLKTVQLVLAGLLLISQSATSQELNRIKNGSFTGPKNIGAAPDWLGISTAVSNAPLINDSSGELILGNPSWYGTPIDSPDGGTWENLPGGTSMYQMVTGLVIGKEYTFKYYYTTQGIVTYFIRSYIQNTPVPPNVEILGMSGYVNPTNAGTLFQ